MTDRTHEVLRACDATVNRSAGYSATVLLTVKSSIGVLEQSRAERGGRAEWSLIVQNAVMRPRAMGGEATTVCTAACLLFACNPLNNDERRRHASFIHRRRACVHSLTHYSWTEMTTQREPSSMVVVATQWRAFRPDACPPPAPENSHPGHLLSG